MSIKSVSGPKEGRGHDELGEVEVSLRDTQFLRIGWVLQKIH